MAEKSHDLYVPIIAQVALKNMSVINAPSSPNFGKGKSSNKLTNYPRVFRKKGL